MSTINTSKVFVAHWDALTERRSFLNEQLEKAGLQNVEWVTSFPASELHDESLITKYPIVFERSKHDNRLSPAVISLLLKHCYIIEEIVKNQYESALVLEDDAVLSNSFTSRFNDYKSQLPEGWDFLWVGTCCDIHA